jgi:hypothetical protein
MSMRLADWVERLRSQTDLVVHGVYTPAAARSSSAHDAAFVTYFADEAQPSTVIGPPRQEHTVAISVLLRVPVRQAGGESVSGLEAARDQVDAALLGWTPPGATGPVTHRNGKAMDREDEGVEWWRDIYQAPQLRSAS